MKGFRIKYTGLTIGLICASIAVFLGGLIFAIIRLINVVKLDLLTSSIYIVLIVLDLILLSFTLSLLCFGKYTIKGEKLILNFGFIKTIYSINEIVELNHFKKTNKLVAYFNNQKYAVIIISPKNYDSFIKAIREINRQIIFDEIIENEEWKN